MDNQSNLIIKALRKYYGSTQAEFANFLGVSQGALSKIEAGKLEVSAFQWISICENYKINPSALVSGVINTDKVKASESAQRKYFRSFKVPKRYSNYAESTVRTAYPFIKFMQEKLGNNAFKEFLKLKGFEQEYFVVLDNPVNLLFINDIVEALIEKNVLNRNNLNELFGFFPIHEIHAYVLEDVQYSTNIQTALVKLIASISQHYERNTQYEFIGEQNCYIQARDADHVSELGINESFKSFRKYYNAKYFEYICNKLRPETMNFNSRATSGGWDVIYA